MSNPNDLIIVNATALVSSGALTILNQFLEHALKDSNHNYICFIHENVKKESMGNLSIIHVKKKNFCQRVIWDLYGLKRYIKKKCLNPKKIISLQNTSVNSKYEQIIYLHQSIPFSEFKLRFGLKYFNFFIYKYIYSFFIFFRTKNTVFVVQTDWMKEALISKKNISENRIHVIKPDITMPDVKLVNLDKKTNANDTVFLYPATPLFYKNHIIILEALKLLKNEGVLGNTIFQVTFNNNENKEFSAKVDEYGLRENIEFLGVISYKELIIKYIYADALLFPSYLESFGLPLAEGATLGKYIICSDLPYARDVLNNYINVDYITYNNTKEWASAIRKIIIMKRDDKTCVFHDSSRFIYNPKTCWADFFKLL